MIHTELQTSFDPVCFDLKNQIEVLRNEIVYKLAPVQIGMKKYCFKHPGNFHNLHDHVEPNLVHDSHGDNNLMQFDQLHVEDGPNLVRYFEKLVRQPPQNNTGETVHDCIDFDELLNDIHSTAASAQLLQRSLSGSSEPTL